MPARLRPPTGADAAAVLELILARDVADVGAPDFTLEDLHADWAGVDLENDARARGRGQGRTLLLALLDAFRRAGLRHAELSVNGRNRGALRLYESAGLRPTWEAERWEKALGA